MYRSTVGLKVFNKCYYALEGGRCYKVRLLVINSYCTLEVLVLILNRIFGIEAHGKGRRNGGGGCGGERKRTLYLHS